MVENKLELIYPGNKILHELRMNEVWFDLFPPSVYKIYLEIYRISNMTFGKVFVQREYFDFLYFYSLRRHDRYEK